MARTRRLRGKSRLSSWLVETRGRSPSVVGHTTNNRKAHADRYRVRPNPQFLFYVRKTRFFRSSVFSAPVKNRLFFSSETRPRRRSIAFFRSPRIYAVRNRSPVGPAQGSLALFYVRAQNVLSFASYIGLREPNAVNYSAPSLSLPRPHAKDLVTAAYVRLKYFIAKHTVIR